ncbi:ABC transporter substrate-binding protein [Schlegelella sp. S2-27]|uniref:ABC transporter substrate-binding protein n=1 Tax=Caldimonas mangrovi TaxID=2944811 RepID=A0ABT0YQC8_9BURK|nr:ABC transporter substrate-binding protein [Caldimonas mangrovi]MCM5680945.1 ABC transporter substrate-binding protein [Caldimonas mangrovi]
MPYPLDPSPLDRPRRRLLHAAALAPLSALSGTPAAARSQAAGVSARAVQILDMSTEQQELSRDYSTGVRLAWTELARSDTSAAGISLATVQTDGSPAGLEQALAELRDDAATCVLIGSVGDRLAVQSVTMARKLRLSIAHVGPWMADSRHDGHDEVFCLFASREQQMRHALQSLEGMGLAELGIVYPRASEQAAYQNELQVLLQKLKLRAKAFVPRVGDDWAALAEQLPGSAPAVLLFLGGTLELARFSQALARRGLQRYVVSLSDVDVPTLMQVGSGPSVPLILTQVVPNPQTSSIPVVRHYRHLLRQLFEEAPSHISLAGYLAGRYAAQVLQRMRGGYARDSVLAEFRRRPAVDLDGYRFNFAVKNRGSAYVTQTLLTREGKLIG